MELTAEGLSFAYEAEKTLFQGVDLALTPGRPAFLVGPNGAGKSTLLALLAGTLAPREGRVLLGGEPLAAFPPARRAALVGWLPQGEQEAFGFTVAEAAALGLEAGRPGLALPGPEELARVGQVLATLGLEGLAHRPLGLLSGGERQRARLAAVLAPERPVLLLDEPTAALDPHRAVQVLEILDDLARRQEKSLLVVTHDLNLASLFGDQVHLLAGGGLLASGPPARVFRKEILQEAYGPGLALATHPVESNPVVLPERLREEEP